MSRSLVGIGAKRLDPNSPSVTASAHTGPLSTMTTISSSGATPIAYTHPYIVCHNASNGTLSIWTCTGESSQLPQLQVTLEGVASKTTRPYVLAPDRIVTQSVDDTESTILVHSLPDGRLLDRQVLAPRASNNTLYISESGFIAVWDGSAKKAKVYGLSEEGKLSALGDLSNHVKEDFDSAAQDMTGSSYLPNSVYLTADCFIQAHVRYPSPTVHLTLQSAGAENSARRHAEFGLTRTIPSDLPNAIMNSMLVDSLPIPSSSVFVMAHVEQVLGFNEEHPKTALRSIDSETLALKWCTLVDQKTEWLRYSPATGFLVAYGWMGAEGHGFVVLDAVTGSVLRAESIGKPAQKCGALGAGVHCDLTPEGDELVVVFGDGQLAVVSLSSFVTSGFPRESEGSGESDGLLVTIPCPEFKMSTPVNAKEKRSKANGTWSWIKRAFVIDGNMVVVVPEKGSDFAVLKWT